MSILKWEPTWQFTYIKSMLQPTKNNAQTSGMANQNAIR